VKGTLDGLYFTANVKLLDFIAKVGDRRVVRIIGAKHVYSFLQQIGFIYVFDCNRLSLSCHGKTKEDADEPVIMARGRSSRGSRRATREPGSMERRSTSSRETSRLMGIGNRFPSTRRKVSTTLCAQSIPEKSDFSGGNGPVIILLVQEAL
jgi:hypothetical protein